MPVMMTSDGTAFQPMVHAHGAKAQDESVLPRVSSGVMHVYPDNYVVCNHIAIDMLLSLARQTTRSNGLSHANALHQARRCRPCPNNAYTEVAS